MRINPYIVLIATSGLMLATVAFAQPAPASRPPGHLNGSSKDMGPTLDTNTTVSAPVMPRRA